MLKLIMLALTFCCTMLNAQNPLVNRMFAQGNVLELVEQFIPENPVIVEAGAHYGEHTKLLAEKWPKGTVHAFEPFPHGFAVLKEQTEQIANVKRYPYALFNTIGKLKFYVCINGDSASSLLEPQPILNSYLIFDKQPIEVDSITLDEWAKQNGIDHVDFMWLDMEGAELTALKAAISLMPTLKAIYSEVNFQEFRKGNCFYNELKEWLAQQGFTELFSELNTSWQGNVLFVRNTNTIQLKTEL